MSKKDFIAIAAAIRNQKNDIEASTGLNGDERAAALNTLSCTANALAKTFIFANPRFDAARFNTACGF